MSAVRRFHAYQRKLEKAFRPLPVENISHIYSFAYNRGIVESQTYFTYKGEKLRLDHCIHLDERLPSVNDIREIIWEDIDRTVLRLRNDV